MAFVNEKYPVEDKLFVDSLVAARLPFTRSPGLSSWWTVDRERNAFLALVGKEGGGYEGTPETCHYVLVVGEYKINFSGECQVTGNMSKGEPQIVIWNIRKLSILSGLEKDQALALVQEALDAQGLHNSRGSVASVNINFNSALMR